MTINLGKLQFILLLLSTAFETFFFNQAMFNNQYLLAGFWGVLLYRNIKTSFIMSRLAKALDKQLK